MKKETHVPEWMLERYLLNELPRQKRRQLEKELEQDPALRAELEKLRLSDQKILSAYPAERMIPEILKRAELAKREPTSPRRWRLAWVAAPVMALAVFLLVILPPFIKHRLDFPENPNSEDYTGLKGSGPISAKGPGLQIFRKNGDAVERLLNENQAAAGDLLQLSYTPGDETHGVIVSIDGRGSVTLHFPDHAQGDTALKKGRRILLPTAYKLDNAPRFERFFFITGKEPLPTTAILKKAGELAVDPNKAMAERLDLPGRYGQFFLLVRK